MNSPFFNILLVLVRESPPKQETQGLAP